MSSWFSASILLRSVHSLQSMPAKLWQERVVLIRAANIEDALERADRLGAAAEHEYEVSEPIRHTVKWTFVKTESVNEILDDDLEDGTEVFSRFMSASTAAAILEPLGDE